MPSSPTIRNILHLPPSLRPLLLHSPPRNTSSYHSYEHAATSPYREPEQAILSAAYAHIPRQGFTRAALAQGAKDAGYLDISLNLFPRGVFELVQYHLTTQRLALGQRVQFPDAGAGPTNNNVGSKVRALVLARLRGNADVGPPSRLQEALAQMSLLENISTSTRELALLSDEIWFLAGDTAVDGSWYTKRAGLAGVYAATEVFSTTDQSTEGKDTEEFLDRRLEETRVVGKAVRGTMQWVGFQAAGVIDLLRSKGVRI